MDITTPDYKDAFREYLRRGTPIELSLKNRGKLKRINKQKRTTTHYIWRTQGDGKVRDSHAANNGKVFAWDNPPATGHPGEDYGCRCIAEPYVPEIEESFEIKFYGIRDAAKRWTADDFVLHYWFGKGRAIKVRETGNLLAIVQKYKELVVEDIKKLPSQIAQKARLNIDQNFGDTFRRSYNMTDIVFSIGDTVIGGSYSGSCRNLNGVLNIEGNIDFYLSDRFEDPLDIRETLGKDILEILDQYGTSDQTLNEILLQRALRQFRFKSNGFLIETKLSTELPGSTPYDIFDNWSGSFSAKIYTDASRSKY